MAEYKRWVSYIYCYENNEKNNNVGYIRVSTRANETKLSVHINSIISEKSLPVYIFFRNEDSIEGVCIGEIAVDKRVVQGTLTVNTYNVMNSGYSLSDAGGVIIYDDAARYYASEWDESSINIEEFTRIDEGKEEKSEQEGEQEREQEEQENSAEPEEKKEVIVLEEAGLINKDTDIIEAAEKMLASFPYMYPFEDDSISKCVRIEPQDIAELPIDKWVLANNSFLLNGYYSYRHLILMKTSDEKSPVYLLGVPGIFKTRDDFLARMFGFKMFKPLKDTYKVKGEFGYWCICITECIRDVNNIS